MFRLQREVNGGGFDNFPCLFLCYPSMYMLVVDVFEMKKKVLNHIWMCDFRVRFYIMLFLWFGLILAQKWNVLSCDNMTM